MAQISLAFVQLVIGGIMNDHSPEGMGVQLARPAIHFYIAKPMKSEARFPGLRPVASQGVAICGGMPFILSCAAYNVVFTGRPPGASWPQSAR